MNSMLAALVNGILVSIPLAFVGWLALRLTPRAALNAATRYAIWWAALVVTVVLPLSYYHFQTDGPVAGTAEASVAVASDAVSSRPGDGDAALVVAESAGTLQRSPVGFHISFPISIEASPWLAGFLIVWLAAAGAMLLRLIASAFLLERHKARASTLRLAAGGFRVASSDRITVPLVAGPWRRVILLPASLLKELSAGELDQIVRHEAAHLARRDDLALLIQRATQALFVLHPVVAWICAQIDLEREIACDDFVIGAGGDSIGYASCLARVVELSGGIRALPMAAAAVEDKSHLARRVEMLLDNTRHTGPGLLRVHSAVAVACLGALAFGAERTPAVRIFVRPVVTRHAVPAVPKPATTAPAPLVAQAAPARVAPAPRPPAPVAPRPEPLPTFDAVSIKPNPVLAGHMFEMFKARPSIHAKGDRFVEEQTTLQYLVMRAYGVWDYQISGLPEWGKAPDGEHYAIEAVIADGKTPTNEQLQLMVQGVLAERFQLKLHRETKSLPVYALMVAGNGSKLQEVSDPKSGGTMQQLINVLSVVVSLPIVDKTSLTGSYDTSAILALHWAELGAAHRADPLSVPEALESALEDKVGLKLEQRKDPTDVLVIDHVEKPSPN